MVLYAVLFGVPIEQCVPIGWLAQRGNLLGIMIRKKDNFLRTDSRFFRRFFIREITTTKC